MKKMKKWNKAKLNAPLRWNNFCVLFSLCSTPFLCCALHFCPSSSWSSPPRAPSCWLYSFIQTRMARKANNNSILSEYMDKIKWNAPQYTYDKDLPLDSPNHYKIVVVGDGAVGMKLFYFIYFNFCKYQSINHHNIPICLLIPSIITRLLLVMVLWYDL